MFIYLKNPRYFGNCPVFFAHMSSIKKQMLSSPYNKQYLLNIFTLHCGQNTIIDISCIAGLIDIIKRVLNDAANDHLQPRRSKTLLSFMT